MVKVDDPGMSREEPPISAEEVERLDRQADMERLRMVSDERRREVELMDMMGQYGSKVGDSLGGFDEFC